MNLEQHARIMRQIHTRGDRMVRLLGVGLLGVGLLVDAAVACRLYARTRARYARAYGWPTDCWDEPGINAEIHLRRAIGATPWWRLRLYRLWLVVK